MMELFEESILVAGQQYIQVYYYIESDAKKNVLKMQYYKFCLDFYASDFSTKVYSSQVIQQFHISGYYQNLGLPQVYLKKSMLAKIILRQLMNIHTRNMWILCLPKKGLKGIKTDLIKVKFAKIVSNLLFILHYIQALERILSTK